MKNNQGFTLIELMIVVEIIAIVAAIALPNYIRTRIQTNEAAAVASLRVILDAETSYNTQYYVYANDITLLTNENPPFLEGGDWTSPATGTSTASKATPSTSSPTPPPSNTTPPAGTASASTPPAPFATPWVPNQDPTAPLYPAAEANRAPPVPAPRCPPGTRCSDVP